MICQETAQGSLVFHRRVFLRLILHATYQIIETGDIVAYLNLQMTLTIEPFDEETILLFVKSDALHANLI